MIEIRSTVWDDDITLDMRYRPLEKYALYKFNNVEPVYYDKKGKVIY